MYIEHKARELQPFSQMPVWARLLFAKMIPETYFLDRHTYDEAMSTEPLVPYFWTGNLKQPRQVSEAIVQGFWRDYDNTLWVEFTLEWIVNGEMVALEYLWPTHKDNF